MEPSALQIWKFSSPVSLFLWGQLSLCGSFLIWIHWLDRIQIRSWIHLNVRSYEKPVYRWWWYRSNRTLHSPCLGRAAQKLSGAVAVGHRCFSQNFVAIFNAFPFQKKNKYILVTWVRREWLCPGRPHQTGPGIRQAWRQCCQLLTRFFGRINLCTWPLVNTFRCPIKTNFQCCASWIRCLFDP